MQDDITNITKRNIQNFNQLSVEQRQDLLKCRERTSQISKTFKKQYENFAENEIIDSEVVNNVFEVYREYYAALEKYFGHTNRLSILLGKLRELSG